MTSALKPVIHTIKVVSIAIAQILHVVPITDLSAYVSAQTCINIVGYITIDMCQTHSKRIFFLLFYHNYSDFDPSIYPQIGTYCLNNAK